TLFRSVNKINNDKRKYKSHSEKCHEFEKVTDRCVSTRNPPCNKIDNLCQKANNRYRDAYLSADAFIILFLTFFDCRTKEKRCNQIKDECCIQHCITYTKQ